MKPLLSILIFLLFTTPLGGQERTSLTLGAKPIESVRTSNGSIWNLSTTETDANRSARYLMYGDTLLSETIDGNRRWYSVNAGDVHLIREESLRHACVPALPIPTNAFGKGATCMESGYEAIGHDGHTSCLRREGKYRSSPPVKGKLVVSTGDTIAATLTMEECVYVEKESASTALMAEEAKADSLLQVSFTRYRWFHSSPFPVAVQTEEKGTLLNGADVYHNISAYTADFSDHAYRPLLDGDNPEDADAYADRLVKSISARFSDGRIIIEPGLPLPEGGEPLEIAVSSEGGIPYFHGSYDVSTVMPVSVSCDGYPPGRYVVGVRCRAASVKLGVTVK